MKQDYKIEQEKAKKASRRIYGYVQCELCGKGGDGGPLYKVGVTKFDESIYRHKPCN